MFRKLKNMSRLLVGAVLVVLLGGCIFVEHDHEHWHHEHPDVVYVH